MLLPPLLLPSSPFPPPFVLPIVLVLSPTDSPGPGPSLDSDGDGGCEDDGATMPKLEAWWWLW